MVGYLRQCANGEGGDALQMKGGECLYLKSFAGSREKWRPQCLSPRFVHSRPFQTFLCLGPCASCVFGGEAKPLAAASSDPLIT